MLSYTQAEATPGIKHIKEKVVDLTSYYEVVNIAVK
jgi:hypothetical protein